ncbi:putative metal-binding protein [Encephalitozoon romaleae SJ-2008]|uniref:Metal-binding protein n=1 Tax=Encephalitozoon romaleae (strain SJ-2008) TaxID=1178016 RepID=I7ATP7_ENCRO|nr:putative metal-binding protein [Encephalitozoon romaleae SJ-2008]AFN83852.1 putative metal-binding protein [Encephalitozoon romaleae SJ-2008]
MLELPPDTRKGFLYLTNDEVFSAFKGCIGLDFLYMENQEGVKIMAVSVMENSLLWSEDPDVEEALPDAFRCLHGNEMTYKSLNRLPQEGWEELIDCWSCHNCEFRTMLSLSPHPREGGLLLSNFFFLINDSDLPKCCRNNNSSVRKLFYNEVLQYGCTHEALAYSYLSSYFQNRSVLLLEVSQTRCEIRYFYKTMVITIENKTLCKKEAMKVGVKETDKPIEKNENINEFYSKLIYNIVVSGVIGATALGYRISLVERK